MKNFAVPVDFVTRSGPQEALTLTETIAFRIFRIVHRAQ
jgi:hypothetical protein